MDDFLIRALIAGTAVGLLSGPVGAVMLWRRQAYFGAAIAHGAILGVALGLLAGVPPHLAAPLTCFALALLMDQVFRTEILSSDTVIGVVGHGSLAGALIAMVYLDRVRIDLMGYLFGDILAIGPGALQAICAAAVGVGALMAVLWRPLVAVATEPDIARAEGAPEGRLSLLFALLLAGIIAMGIQLVGVLLIVSLLVMPAAAARPFAATPLAMAALGSCFAVVSVVAGLIASYWIDWPAGPAIAFVAALIFAVTALLGMRRH